MFLLHQMLLTASLLVNGVIGSLQATSTSGAAPPAETFTTGYPQCNVSGYTLISDTYVEYTYSMKSTLSLCIQACRENITCWSIAWVPPDTQCIFYNECVEKTDLLKDDTSPFMHWDDICDVV